MLVVGPPAKPPDGGGRGADGAARRQGPALSPDLVYGANDGIITTFAVVSGVVGASLSNTVIVVLGFANLVADGFSMGASNYLARSDVENAERAEQADAASTAPPRLPASSPRARPRCAYRSARRLLPLPGRDRAHLRCIFLVGASRSFATRAGLRSGAEMLVVGSFAAAVAYAIGSFASSLTGE